MTMFQCLPIFASLLYLPSRYLQQSRFDSYAVVMYAFLFQTNSKSLYPVKKDKYLCSNFMQVDVAIMEVGLGGKYDATNVVCIIVFSSETWSLQL